MFQSTPANFTAGDTVTYGSPPPAASFNPRPPISQRATTRAAACAPGAPSFNPRPPISQRATTAWQGTKQSGPTFQSTPANFTAGDRVSRVRGRADRRFNPRPPISQRATVQSQRHPLVGQVSIHARQFHSGRRPNTVRIDGILMFQSTPANFTAGDVVQPLAQAAVRLVSIHARQFHSGRPVRPGRS